MIYLNVGHTGLDERTLNGWISRNAVRAVYLIHDLIPLTHPEFCRPGEAEKHRRRMSIALATARGIIVNSQATLADLATFAQGSGQAMPPSVVAWISGFADREPVSARRLDRPYFVTVGTIEGRKNHALLLRVWAELARESGTRVPALVVIGQRGWEAENAIKILDDPGNLSGHLIELSNCSDAELAAWIAGARALLMPSFVEGFGLPIIEALQLGTPVIASDLPVYREIVGDIPTYLHPIDDLGWKETVVAFATDGPERGAQLERMAGYRPPDWSGHFAIVQKWLETL